MVYILLSMIVKNESRILQRCIESCLSIVDGISICDTGSTDNTVEIIEENIKKLKGLCHKHEWKNFGHNRSLSIEACRETATKLGFPLDQTYALLMDADMKLVVSKDFQKQQLKDAGYTIIQKNGSLSYHNTRFVKLSLPWKCIGVTHEYWGGDGCHSTKLDTLYIDDVNDGGAKADKYERDIRLLTQGLIDEPENGRYMFYLAQSYKDSGNQEKAIEYYKKRVDVGGWYEEVYYAMYQMGICYQRLGKESDMLYWLTQAYQHHQGRAETLYELANYYRLKGKNALSALYAFHALMIPYPKNDLLFISPDVYHYKCHEELSISGYYVSNLKDHSMKSCDILLTKEGIPEHSRELAKRNILFYVKNVEWDQVVPIDLRAPIVKGNPSKKYNVLNPVIHWNPERQEFIGNIRTVNYSQIKGNYESFSPDKKIRTRNFFVHMDDKGYVKRQYEIMDTFARTKYEGHVLGFEDLRLFEYQGQYWVLTNSLEETTTYRPQQCLGRLKFNSDRDQYEVSHYVRCVFPNMKDIEKNWLPFVHENTLYFIYHSQPFTILKPNVLTGECQVYSQQQPIGYDFSNFRGSAQPIPYENGYLYVIHEVSFVNWRTYYHRLVQFNKNFEITKISRPFTFEHSGVEFCISLTQKNQDFYFGTGIEDAKANMYKLSSKKLKELF